MAFFLPRLLQTTRQYAYSSSKRASKLWSTGPSKFSNALTSNANADLEAQDTRLEVLRTVEMESWSEATNKTISVPNMYNVAASQSRTPSAFDKVDLKTGEVICHTSVPSSSSGPTSSGPSTPPRSPLEKEF